VLNGFGKSLEVILPKLRDGYIVPDPGFARDLALENPDAFFLSRSGECFHNVTVTGGKQRAEGPLSMKRELRDVMRLLGELEDTLRGEELRVLTLGREIKELTSLLDRLEGEKREAEKQGMTSGHLLQQLDSEMERASERLHTCRQELQRLVGERGEQEELINARQAEMAALQEKGMSNWPVCANAAIWRHRMPPSIWPGWPPSRNGNVLQQQCWNGSNRCLRKCMGV
jgi:chromosome segregation protein